MYVSHIRIMGMVHWPSQLELQNTPTVSLQKARPLPHIECPGYDTKQSDGKAPVILELWGMQSSTSLPSLPSPLWRGVVAPDMVLSFGQTEAVYLC